MLRLCALRLNAQKMAYTICTNAEIIRSPDQLVTTGNGAVILPAEYEIYDGKSISTYWCKCRRFRGRGEVDLHLSNRSRGTSQSSDHLSKPIEFNCHTLISGNHLGCKNVMLSFVTIYPDSGRFDRLLESKGPAALTPFYIRYREAALYDQIP